ncbi:uncharacterized protein LOC132554808 isoform X2 [Ylistrum balloti]|uniref:uncharacterized protein LOC132554808 isoform X2 n=1 Tax=Ylistrum balloti TaxID=509963 RepID=UPI002905D820|nr:uncharacterized protein LOC132554808 isoform X2 [Ylistrum balloti]
MSSRIVSVIQSPPGKKKQFPVTNNVLHKENLVSMFFGATGLEYCLDGVWKAVDMTEDMFNLPSDVSEFEVVSNVYDIDGHSHKKFKESEITKISRRTPVRHLAVIIGNSDFGREPLPGATTDLNVMTEIFSMPPFNYTILKCSNLTVQQMKEVVKDAVAVGRSAQNLQSFLFSVSTHGFVSQGQQMFRGVSYYNSVSLLDLMTPILALPSPKVFLVNACRYSGFEENVPPDPGVEVKGESTMPPGGVGDGDTPMRSGDQIVPLPSLTNNINMDSYLQLCPTNCLIVYGCLAGEGTYDFVPSEPQETRRISWLVCSLKKVWESMRTQDTVDMLDLFTQANGYCSRKLEAAGRKYTFVLEHRLTSVEGLCFSQQKLN